MLNVAEGRSPKELESRRRGRKEEPRRCQEMGWREKPKKGHKGERKQKCRLNKKKGCGKETELKAGEERKEKRDRKGLPQPGEMASGQEHLPHSMEMVSGHSI